MIPIIIILLLNVYAQEVKELKEDYSDYISENEVVFVKYFAPWCGHCKKLKPIYEQLAKSMSNKLKFAEVNCEDFREICDNEMVEGFPTLKIFRKGKSPKLYSGERSEEAMKNWIEKQLTSPLKQVEESEIEKLKENSFVLVRSKKDDGIRQDIELVADTVEYLDFYIIDSDLDKYKIEVYNADKKEMIEYNKEFNANEFVEFVNLETLPVMHHLNYELFKRVDSIKELYSLWYFFDASVSKEHEEMFRKLEKEYHGKFSFFTFDKALSEQQVKQFFHSGKKYPVVSVVHKNKRNIYALSEDIEINEENIKKFLNDILENKIKVNVKVSEKIPDEEQKDVKKLIATELDDFVNAKGKDSLIIFCVEKSEACKYFLGFPLTNVAKRMKAIESFQIAWIDASTDVVDPIYALDNIPTIYLSSEKEGKTQLIKMTEMPSEDNTMKFISENAFYKFEMPEKLPGDKKNDEDEPEADSDGAEEGEKKEL